MRVPSFVSLLIIGAIACGGGSPPAATPAVPPPTPEPAATPTAAKPAPPAVDPAAAEGPSAEDTLGWVLQALTGPTPLSRADVEARFAPSFLQQVSAAQVVELFGILRVQLPPLQVVKQESKAPLALTAWLTSKAGGLRVDIVMSASTPRKIEGLLFKNASTEPPPASYQEAVARLAKAGASHQLYVARLDRGACTPVFDANGERRLALGSTSKLWVLLALDEKLRKDKTLSWDHKLPVRDEAKSLPSGTMQDEPAGTQHTLREFATQMISISDNTATDHLIEFVGDAGMARALTLARHGKPELHRPYLRTRDLFSLKISATAEQLAVYRKAPIATRRELLAELRTRPIDLAAAIASWTSPRSLDLEWFASGPELCRTLAALAERGQRDPKSELLQILGKNPGVELDAKQWRYVGFKGGSEPGVMHLAYLLQRADDAWFVAVIGVNDPSKLLDEGAIAGVATGVLGVLGATPAPKP